jgi:hypothetical protein
MPRKGAYGRANYAGPARSRGAGKEVSDICRAMGISQQAFLQLEAVLCGVEFDGICESYGNYGKRTAN